MRNAAVAFGIQFAMLAPDAQGKIMREVRLYTRQWCGWCVEAKEYLKAHDIPFQEIDVGRDPAANEEMQRLSGQRYVPTKHGIRIGQVHSRRIVNPSRSQHLKQDAFRYETLALSCSGNYDADSAHSTPVSSTGVAPFQCSSKRAHFSLGLSSTESCASLSPMPEIEWSIR